MCIICIQSKLTVYSVIYPMYVTWCHSDSSIKWAVPDLRLFLVHDAPEEVCGDRKLFDSPL